MYHEITQSFINAICNNEKFATATVYDRNNELFATYSKNTAIEVAREINGIAVDDETGEILQG